MTQDKQANLKLTRNIIIGLILGVIVGLILNFLPRAAFIEDYIITGILKLGGEIFVTVMKMLVVPIVFFSLVTGTFSLGNPKKLGRIGIKTILLYLFTTAVAITLALFFAWIFGIGLGAHLTTDASFTAEKVPSLYDTVAQMVPENPIAAMVQGKMLQIIIFSIFLGLAISLTEKHSEPMKQFFISANEVTLKLIQLLLFFAPYGVFCLLASMFARMGFSLIMQLVGYFFTVVLVLIIHVLFTNSIILTFLARLNPLHFFKKMFSVMIFAFSTSSSNVTIPVTLNAVEKKLGVNNSVASFVIPLGATINMDGTAIMQGVATVFIANIYHIPLGIGAFATVIITATLASIGTAGVPGVGLIMLAMVLKQVGLPVEGIALIIGVDRLLDMLRTAVNVTGDAAVSCVVAKSEGVINEKRFVKAVASQ